MMDPDIVATVRPQIAVILEDAGNNWSAYAPSVPGVGVTAATAEAARQLLEEALAIHFDELYVDEMKATPAVSQ